jgi:transposase
MSGFSLDLRERIVARVAQGHSRRDAARHFGVSDSCAVKLLARVRDTGSLLPGRQGAAAGRRQAGGAPRFLDRLRTGQARRHDA